MWIIIAIVAAVYAFNAWATKDIAKRAAAKEAARNTPAAIKRRAQAKEEDLRHVVAALEADCRSLVEPPSWDTRQRLAQAKWELEYMRSTRRRRPMR